jgi:Fic family protein
MARPLTIGILADGIEKLAQIDQQMKQVWDRAALLANEGRGTSLEKINKRLFQTGSICVSDIVRECDITPQAAHYQIKRLLKAGILSRGPRGRAGGHYFLDVLLQI